MYPRQTIRRKAKQTSIFCAKTCFRVEMAEADIQNREDGSSRFNKDI
jgi:hypothetical protein